MRYFVVLLLTVSLLYGEKSFRLIGLSGTKYPLTTYSYKKDSYVSPQEVCQHLYFSTEQKGDTLRCFYKKKSALLIRGKSSAFIGKDTIPLSQKIISLKKNIVVSVDDIDTVMSALSGLVFKYKPVDVSLTIFKPQSEEYDSTVTGIIVLDPGHGGKDPGAIGPLGTKEKDIVLAVSKEVKRIIEEKSRLTVHMTRSKDIFVPLGHRTTFANEKKASLFVSLHANASPKKDSIEGYKMYFLSEAKNETDERIEMFENSVIALEDERTNSLDELQSILLDMANDEYLKESQDLSIMMAESFGRNIDEITTLHTGVGQANFHVLRGAMMPAVLVETCFISNSYEEKLLQQKEFQKDVAHAIAMAIIHFKSTYGAENE